ncbi:MAG: CheR family methyltransferase [Thermoleophilaceae bacterium]
MTSAEDLQSLLEYLKQTRGFDFTGYKTSSLERRIKKRMDQVNVETYAEYQDFLEVTPDEFTDLFNTILINVTAFFRDERAWEYLAEELIPKLLEELPDPQPIRVWSAACASGEEAYTVAMLLAEAMGEEDFKRRVKIYATDVDEEALTIARHATYSREDLEAVPDGLAEKYFEPSPLGQVFRPELRRSVIFGRNDLVQDAPISRIDLLISRNALMYFTPEAQGRILSHFNFALNHNGYLFLGKSEMLVTHTDLFTPYDLKWRVFRKVVRSGLRERLSFITDVGTGEGDQPVHRQAQLAAAAIEIAPEAMLVVDRAGFVVAINQRARGLFGLGPADLGRPLQDLDVSYQPADLRSAIAQAAADRKRVQLGRYPWSPRPGDERTIEITVTPMSGNGATVGATIRFADVTEHARLDEEHERSKRQLETAYEELQSTVEELETTNEELHSTNEELETTNEELQSSNEELETMNEELQSTNDELESMNEEQQTRGSELDRLNLFLEGILGSLGVGVVVVDEDQIVQVWNASSTELWGLRPEEADGRPILSLDINFPLEDLREALRSALGPDGQATETTVEAVNRRGRSFTCWVRVLPLRAKSGDTYGAIVLMADREIPTEVAVP